MSSHLQIPIKFCKSLLASSSTNFSPWKASRFLDKLIYEFWGFCVNGGTSLSSPGGFADVSYPSGFENGSAVIASGSAGRTSFGNVMFTSEEVNFESLEESVGGSLIGKYLVTWAPGSDSTDDSIYMIHGVEDPSHLVIDIHSGGTRRLGNHPVFWSRDNINWRIVDFDVVTTLSGWSDGHYMVLNFPAAPTVNAEQSIPQVKYIHHSSSSGEGKIGLIISPSGSWNGSDFSDATPEVTQSIFVESIGSHRGQALYTLIGGGDFLIMEVRGDSGETATQGGVQGSASAGSGFHIEVPKRLYGQEFDPNPIAWVTWSNAAPSQVSDTYYDGFMMVCLDGEIRRWKTLVRSPGGTGVRMDYIGSGQDFAGQWQQFTTPGFRFGSISYSREDNTYITSDGLLSLNVSGQFSAGRARLRRVRFMTANLLRGGRIGDPLKDPYGWVYVSNGVLWPWDNTLLPQRPWRFGV